jgi:DNA-binding response OmpR family regulator
MDPKPVETSLVFSPAEQWVRQEGDRAKRKTDTIRPTERFVYRFNMGLERVTLNIIEFRILTFLASRPYHAFRREEIVKAVTCEQFPVSNVSLHQHITGLRGKLGVFRDYVQRVPYIGYRFKA